MREERKVVTVLFCDLVGSTAQAERLDPEDVRALLSHYHEQVKAELERFGGTVEKFIGDAVMALFGAPAAHEDDPERAVRAALGIREWAQEAGELQVRIGITTGEALVALTAQPARRGGHGLGRRCQHGGTAPKQRARRTACSSTRRRTARRGSRLSTATAALVEAKGKKHAVNAVGGHPGEVEVRRRRPAGRRSRPRRARERARTHHPHARTGPSRARAATRHARGGPRHRKEPPRVRALPPRRRGTGLDDLAAGPLSSLRRGRELLGARRDGESPGGDPRHGRL